MDQNKIDKYWELIDEFYKKAPDSEQLLCGHEEWNIEFGRALDLFEKGMDVQEIRKILDDVFCEMTGGSIILGPITNDILPVLLYDWLNEVDNASNVEDFFQY